MPSASNLKARVASSTAVSPAGDQDCSPPAVCPAAIKRLTIHATRSATGLGIPSRAIVRRNAWGSPAGGQPRHWPLNLAPSSRFRGDYGAGAAVRHPRWHVERRQLHGAIPVLAERRTGTRRITMAIAHRSGPIFARRAKVGFVVIDRRRTSRTLREFAARAFELQLIEREGDFELHLPGGATAKF